MQNSYRHLVVEFRVERTISQSRILVKGKVVPNEIPENPDVCPLDCKKKRDFRLKPDLRFIEPQTALLTRHHADKRIGLFYCDGCPHLLFKSLIVPIHEAPNNINLHENVKTEHAEDDSITFHSAKSLLTAPTHSMMSSGNKETGVLEYEGPSPTAMNGDFKLLTERMNKTLHTRGFDLICRRCGKSLEVGDLFHRRGASRKTKKFYHKSCWEALLN